MPDPKDTGRAVEVGLNTPSCSQHIKKEVLHINQVANGERNSGYHLNKVKVNTIYPYCPDEVSYVATSNLLVTIN